MTPDPHRTAFHFQPSRNWMNDPNGLIQWQGRYHMFYQHNPNGPLHADMHWGHAVSDDMLHWTHLPLALTPTPGGPDEAGCWSGCTVVHQGVPTFVYSGNTRVLRGGRAVHQQLPCLASSRDDDLITWQKDPANPVIPAPPPELDLIGFRDHCLWQEGETWYHLIGAGIRDVGGAALLYRSLDLHHWDYVGPILIGDKDQTDPVYTGTMWECPDFFPLGDKHVLLISVHRGATLYTVYFVGTYAAHKFTPERVLKLDYGDNYFYAPQTFQDAQDRRIMFGWLQEGRGKEAMVAAGWSGVMSVPRVLSLRPDGLLGVEPAAELAALRRDPRHFTDLTLTPGDSNVIGEVRGDTLEIKAEVEPGQAQQLGLILRRSPAGREQTRIVYDCRAATLTVDRSQTSLDPAVDSDTRGGPLPLAPGETLKLHLLLDGSTIEIFANGHFCLTSRVYPTRPDSLGVDCFARGGNATLKSLHIWTMTQGDKSDD